MEKNIYTDNFERMLKEKSDDFKMIPSKRVWHSIYNDLHPSRRWPSVAMSLFLIAALLVAGYLNTEKSKNPQDKNTTAKNADDNAVAVGGNGQTKNLGQDLSVRTGTASNNVFAGTNSFASDQFLVLGQSNLPTQKGYQNSISSIISQINQTSNYKPIKFSARTAHPVQAAHVNTTSPAGDIGSSNNTPANNNTSVAAEYGISTTTEPLIEKTNNSSEPSQPAGKNKITGLLTNEPLNNAGSNTTEKKSAASTVLVNESVLAEQKAWMDGFTLYNKPAQKKWKGKLSWEAYTTPAVTFRKLSNNGKYNVGSANSIPAAKPSLGLEAGATLVYAFAKNFRLKTGIQFNYTNYNMSAWETNHPVLTTVTLNDATSGYPYQAARSTSLTTTPGGIAPVKLHSNTYQLSAVAGLDVKLYGNDHIEWFAGATIQPSYVIGGRVYLLSSDHNNYIAENSLLRRFNLSGGLESFVSYKSGRYTWQVGPQLRYQFMSTYDKKYNQKETLINGGVKVGITRLF